MCKYVRSEADTPIYRDHKGQGTASRRRSGFTPGGSKVVRILQQTPSLEVLLLFVESQPGFMPTPVSNGQPKLARKLVYQSGPTDRGRKKCRRIKTYSLPRATAMGGNMDEEPIIEVDDGVNGNVQTMSAFAPVGAKRNIDWGRSSNLVLAWDHHGYSHRRRMYRGRFGTSGVSHRGIARMPSSGSHRYFRGIEAENPPKSDRVAGLSSQPAIASTKGSREGGFTFGVNVGRGYCR